MKFKSIIASILSITCAACALTARAATTAPRTESASRQLTQDEEWDLKDGALSVDNGVVVDLNGFNLTYNNVAGTSTGAGTITNSSSKLSTLTFNVASAKTLKTLLSGLRVI